MRKQVLFIYVSRNRSAKELRLICSFFMATSVKIIWFGCTPCAAASGHSKNHSVRFQSYTEKGQRKPNSWETWKHSSRLVREKNLANEGNGKECPPHVYIHVRTLISPAAGNLRNQMALLGTRLRILHLIQLKWVWLSMAPNSTWPIITKPNADITKLQIFQGPSCTADWNKQI